MKTRNIKIASQKTWKSNFMYMCTIYIYGTYHICINIKPMAGIKVILISIEAESKELAIFSKIQS